jgi:hypothetical protein
MEEIRGTMRGIGALEVSESIKGSFLADEGLPLEIVGKLEKRRVVIVLEKDYDAQPHDATAAPSRLDTLRSMQEYLLTEIVAEMAKGEPVKVLPVIPLDTLPLDMEPEVCIELERCCDTCLWDGEEGCTTRSICEDYALWEAK